jgi:hypothetical protein
MKLEAFKAMIREIIREELENLATPEEMDEKVCEGEGCLDEKSVPQPYDRKSARKMNKGQIEKRKQIGRDMMANEKTVSKFRKKYGDEWKDYLWAAASSAAFRQSGSTKSDDKRKK